MTAATMWLRESRKRPDSVDDVLQHDIYAASTNQYSFYPCVMESPFNISLFDYVLTLIIIHMSIHPLAIVLCLLLTSVHLQTCTAPYWEVNSDGSLPVDEAAVIGNNNFTLANVEKSETHNLVKTTWALTSIKGSSRYDNSSISVVYPSFHTASPTTLSPSAT